MKASLQNLTFRWTDKREKAAVDIAEGRLTDAQIAANLGISRQTLATWKRVPEFQARLSGITEAYRAAVLSHGISLVENRVAAKHDRWLKIKQLILARASDPVMLDVPGGDTGLLIRQIKSIGFGKDSKIVEEFVSDTALLRALNDLEKEAAQDLGQWADRHELSGPGGGPIPIASLDLIIEAARVSMNREPVIESNAEPAALPSGPDKEPV